VSLSQIHDNRTPYAVQVAGGGRSSAINRRISAKRFFRNGDLGNLECNVAPELTTLAPILISFSFRLVSDQSLIGSGVANVRTRGRSGIVGYCLSRCAVPSSDSHFPVALPLLT
jgi:hypothetical protein